MFKQLQIGMRLYLGFGAVIILTAALAVYAIFNMNGGERGYMLCALAVVVSGGALFAWRLTRSIVRPLQDAKVLAAAIATGNPTSRSRPATVGRSASCSLACSR